MSSLVLQLRPGDTLLLNGASVRFPHNAVIELTAHARFVFGKQVMSPEAADTPARQLYLALQTAYVGSGEERERGLMTARALTAALRARSKSALTRDTLERALAAAIAGNGYAAVKLGGLIIQQEEAEFGRPQPKLKPPRVHAAA